MSDNPQPLELPKKFDKCPACGSTRRFTKEAMSDIEPSVKDKIPPGLYQGEMIYLTAEGVPWRILAFVDICIDCGTAYCVKLDKEQGIVEEAIKMDPSFGLGKLGLSHPESQI